ncbi:hypothetical protein [Blastococcus mobilis]|uniref:AMP-binding enzyme C-terminal domain-containing protein n=1 Tax=Blastococcus mobilis TaxID=1938746 RepID=A0A238WEZ8_9ACTN|nr:hypothetical protein [Blastococcus mobilis]SNR44844.1 hypothetical protein SAMN06272737_107169 [Blastococcus mobilis]
MTNLAQNLLDSAAKDENHPALRMDDAVPKGPTGKILRRAVEVPQEVGQR